MKRIFGFFLKPAVLVVLGALCLALLVWFAGPLLAFAGWHPLESVTARVVCIVALLALWLGKRLVQALRERLARHDITVIDVRPAADRALAPFAAAEVLDEDSLPRLAALPKDAPLAFLCHHGNSSRSAAEHFRGLGFRQVFNVEGGIDAWSREVDPAVPRY